jgi:hypothetical protein
MPFAMRSIQGWCAANKADKVTGQNAEFIAIPTFFNR